MKEWILRQADHPAFWVYMAALYGALFVLNLIGIVRPGNDVWYLSLAGAVLCLYLIRVASKAIFWKFQIAFEAGAWSQRQEDKHE